MKQCSVILVDDDKEDTELLKEAMEKSGRFHIVAACETEAGLVDVLQRAGNLPDAIICDLNLPTRNGIEVHNNLRALDSFADIPFILVSGMEPSPLLYVKAEKEGLTTVMLKPYSAAEYSDFCIELYYILCERKAKRAFCLQAFVIQ